MQTNMDARVDQYGFMEEDKDHEIHYKVLSEYLPVLARRSARWHGVYGSGSVIVKSARLKRFCRKGIPAEWRTAVWMEVSGARQAMDEKPNYYDELVDSNDLDPTVEHSVDMDVNRTYPENIYFANSSKDSLQHPLKRVLCALCKCNRAIGYCQGMNYVAGLLLLIVKNEKQVFWLMYVLLNRILPDYYNPDMKSLKAEQYLFGELVRWKCQPVFDHMQNLDVPWILVSTKWFICLFSDVLPIDTVIRIWDCVFYEGAKILHRAALALVLLNRDRLLSARNLSEMVTCFKSITSNEAAVDCHQFMSSIFKLPGSFPRSNVNRLRHECTEAVKSGKKP